MHSWHVQQQLSPSSYFFICPSGHGRLQTEEGTSVGLNSVEFKRNCTSENEKSLFLLDNAFKNHG